MKKNWILAFLLVGCSSFKGGESRLPNSKYFNCQFEEVIDGNKYVFNFIPEEQLLLVNSYSNGADKIILEESDFSAGGFIFKDAKGENLGKWDLKIDLVSYKDVPEVKLTLNKSPISKAAFESSKKCSISK
ncbi:MAG: hypothetical protein H7281_11065 [Bacteriovorax sp.]|nr:hypothetical protein [Bacteriovorax sp.]